MIKLPYNDPLEHANVDGLAQLKTITNIRDILTEKGIAWFETARVPGSTAAWRELVVDLPIRHTEGVLLVGHNADGACETLYLVPSLAAIQLYWRNGDVSEARAKDIQFNTIELILDHYQADCGGTDVIAFDAHTGARMPELDLP